MLRRTIRRASSWRRNGVAAAKSFENLLRDSGENAGGFQAYLLKEWAMEMCTKRHGY